LKLKTQKTKSKTQAAETKTEMCLGIIVIEIALPLRH